VALRPKHRFEDWRTQMDCVLLTGAAGFIGAHFANHLFDTTSKKLVLVDALFHAADLSRLRADVRCSPRVHVCHLNVRSWAALLSLMRSHQVTEVVHFAAHSHVGRCFDHPLEFTEENVLGTHTLLECARLHGVTRFLHMSTDEVYGSSELKDATPHTEQAQMRPTNPYAASKAAAEHLVLAYHVSFGLKAVIARGNNVYGPGQHCEKLVPNVIQRLALSEPVLVEGDGQQLRAFVHVLDMCRALHLLLNEGLPGHAYNVGSAEEHSVLDVVRAIGSCLKRDPQILFVKDRPFNDRRYYVDSSKIAALGYAPQVSFLQGIQQLCDQDSLQKGGPVPKLATESREAC
jgi:dTDP-glucose 4,6-dehydratase